MADGGTIKTSVTQTVTFYNTESIIEKDKNIYFAPEIKKTTQSGLRTTVRQIWLDAFNAQARSYSHYKDIAISTWSPEDRTLLVKGNVDDFRTDGYEGFALNYFIMTRVVKYDLLRSKTMVYGFFIVNAEQAGQNSVKLTVEPDYFTNVFYLSNLTYILATSAPYSPFNDKMGNVYINRQHYNRVRVTNTDTTESLVLTKDIYDAEPMEEYTVTYSVSSDVIDMSTPLFVVTGGAGVHITAEPTLIVDTHNIVVSFYCEAIADFAQHIVPTLNVVVTHRSRDIYKDNEELFLNTEESYKYRYQEKDYHMPIVNGVSFTRAEMSSIQTANSWADLDRLESLQVKILKCCLSYLKITTKENVVTPYLADLSTFSETWVSGYSGKRISGIYRHTEHNKLEGTLQIFYLPFINIPKQFKHIVSESLIDLQLKVLPRISLPNGSNYVTHRASYVYTFSDYKVLAKNLLSDINKNGYADYIESVQIVKDVLIDDSYFTISGNSATININAVFDIKCVGATQTGKDNNIAVATAGIYDVDEDNITISVHKNIPLLVPFSTSPAGFISNIDNTLPASNLHEFGIEGSGINQGHVIQNLFVLQQEPVINDMSKFNAFPLLMIANQEEIDNEVTLDESNSINLKEDYYDNVLEQEPYSFWSLSYLAGMETPLYKIRYYNSNTYIFAQTKYKVKVGYINSGNDIAKFSYIPIYQDMPYYNEAITVILANQIPLQSDSYFSYFNQNSAQMKNQYAVNNFQRGTDLAQRFFNTAPAQVGAGFVSGGQAGGYAQIIRQVSGMIDDAVDWGQSNEVISMTQRAKLADMGAKPDNLSNLGTDAYYDLQSGENSLYLNHYHIDELSYNSIAKYLERFGYVVNIYDRINDYNRVGMNFVKTNSFDFHTQLTEEQENSIRRIFSEGVTLLHDKSYLTDGHNYETILDE